MKPYSRKIHLSKKHEHWKPSGSYEQHLSYLEHDIRLPDHKRESVLKEVFLPGLAHKLETLFPVSRLGYSLSDDDETHQIKVETSTIPTVRTYSSKSISDLEENEVLKKPPSDEVIEFEPSIHSSKETVFPDARRLTIASKTPIKFEKIISNTQTAGGGWAHRMSQKIRRSMSATASFKKLMEFGSSSTILQSEKDYSSDHPDSELAKILNYRLKPKLTPYYEFLKKEDKEAAIWKKNLKKQRKIFTTEERLDMLAEQIAKRFLKWVRQEDLDPTLTTKGIMDMFHLSVDVNKINVRQEELYAIPGQIGWHLGLKKKTMQWVLAEQVDNDKRDFEVPPENNIAFGHHLPISLHKGTTQNTDFKRWMSCNVPEKLETMETVFSDITNLEITKKFAQFIAARPYIKPPEYLVRSGLIKYTTENEVATPTPKSVSDHNIRNMTKRRKALTRETLYTISELPKIESQRYKWRK